MRTRFFVHPLNGTIIKRILIGGAAFIVFALAIDPFYAMKAQRLKTAFSTELSDLTTKIGQLMRPSHDPIFAYFVAKELRDNEVIGPSVGRAWLSIGPFNQIPFLRSRFIVIAEIQPLETDQSLSWFCAANDSGDVFEGRFARELVEGDTSSELIIDRDGAESERRQFPSQ